MKSSNLALRMDVAAGAEESPQTVEREAVSRKGGDSRRRAHFDYRAFDERTIEIRDHGLRPFRVS